MVEGAALVTLLRHGAVAGPGAIYRGALDDPLAPQGWAAMGRQVGRLGPFDRVATSPARRCRAFAADHATAHGLSLEVLAGMAELRFGAWEGLTPDQAAARDPLRHRAFCWSGGRLPPPGGEGLGALRRRVRGAWADWLADGVPGPRLLVTHAGVMRALLMELCGLPPERAWRIALPEGAALQLSHLPGHPPCLLRLAPCPEP